MLDIQLVNRNICHRFVVSGLIRKSLFVTRRSPSEYVPSSVLITVRKPIIRVFDGALRTMPICFGLYHSNLDPASKASRTAVFINYHSKLIVGPEMCIPDNLYSRTPLGQMAIASAASAGLHLIMFVGNSIPLLVDTRGELSDVLESIDVSRYEISTYVEKYKDGEKDYRVHPGIHCMFCERKGKCL